MANPNNAVGTNGAFGGRTSVNAFNDVLSAFSGRGIISGWACSPRSGLTVNLGGNGTDRDVAIAEDGAGNKTTINNISQTPVAVTINAAPASNARIDAIVAYIEDSPNGSGETDNPDVVNVLVVSGTVASAPSAPNDSAIRSAITADGASGATAYYVVLATVRIATGTTDVDATMITQGSNATIKGSSLVLPDGSVNTNAVVNSAVTTAKIADGAVTAAKIDFANFPTASTIVKFGNGANDSVSLFRVGNLVYAGESTVVADVPAGVDITIGITLPVGFRPATGQGMLLGNCIDGQFSNGEPVAVRFYPDGSIRRDVKPNITAGTRIEITGCWGTLDAQPSS